MTRRGDPRGGPRTPSAFARRLGWSAAACAWALHPSPAFGLDKQGSAHGGQVGGSDSGFHFSGAAFLGTSVYNPGYAARPDNTGRALMRYALHADVDLVGRRLSIPLDVNVFSDRERKGAAKLSPSELDLIGGVTSTWEVGLGAVEIGVRGETDRPVDRGTFSQSYLDARARYLYSLAAFAPSVRPALHGGDVSGYATLGVFAVNPSYAARPDNSGRALFRYAFHTDLSLFDSHVGLGVDTTFFTDRETSAARPSELDLTPEIIGRWDPFELRLAYERDMPLDKLGDRPGFVQSLVYALLGWSFDPGAEPGTPARAEEHDGDE